MEHGFDAEVRLTADESKRVVDLAARLQSKHESTIGVEDLALAANEAGIDPRFVHQAVGQLSHSAPSEAVSAWKTTLAFCLAMALIGAFPAIPAVRQTPLPMVEIVAAAAILAGYLADRRRPWLAPTLAPFGFIFGYVGVGLLMKSAGFYQFDSSGLILGYLLIVALGAWVGALVRARRR